MPRLMAIATIPGITEEQFRAALDQVRKWRPDPRTTIIRAACSLPEGKIVAECEAIEQAHFEDWLKKAGWQWDAIYKVDLVHQTGNIWKL